MSIVSLAQHMSSHRGSADGIGTAREQQLQAAAEQFEALFLQQILKQMRKASDVLAEGNPMRSREMDTMRDFYDEVLAETLAGRKQTGIADMLVKQLSGGAGGAPDLQGAALAAQSAELPPTWTRCCSVMTAIRRWRWRPITPAPVVSTSG